MGEILFLTHRVPWPPDRGDKIRAHHLLRALLDLAPVHLGCFAETPEEAAAAHPLKARLASVTIAPRTKPQWRAGAEALLSGKPVSLTAFASNALAASVQQLLAERPISHIVAFSGQMAQFVPLNWAGHFLMDLVDVDSAKFAAYAAASHGPMAWVHAREARLLSAYERQIAARCNQLTLVSAAEAALLRAALPSALAGKVSALENGIDTAFYDPDAVIPVPNPGKGPLLVFTGQMDYRPNVEAVVSFAKESLPLIAQRFAGATFAIVGRQPAPAVTALTQSPSIIVTGAVADVRGWLAAADVIVAPLRTARGVQNKVLEAMAMARPVVASHAAAEGIDARDGEHFLVAASPQEEAASILRLLDDPARRQSIGAAARQHMLARYGWAAQLSRLPELLGLAASAPAVRAMATCA